jgi:hypothetical protein
VSGYVVSSLTTFSTLPRHIPHVERCGVRLLRLPGRSSVGVEALDQPAGRSGSNPGRRGLRAVHEPKPYVAAGVLPENVAPAVAVEVAGRDNRPASGHGSNPGSVTCALFMNQSPTLLLPSRHRMSLLPSPLKSPVPAIDQPLGPAPTPAAVTCAPFMNQIPTLPLP